VISRYILIATIVLAVASNLSRAQPLQRLMLTAFIDVSEYVTVSGKVTLTSGEGVAEVVVSVQVVSPFGSTIHLARLFTDKNGGFSTRCTLTPRVTMGKYTASITASREGYADAYYTASFVVAHEDFYLSISPNVLLIRQGEAATLNIDVVGIAGYNETVSLTVGSASPKGVSYRLSNETARANATVTLLVLTTQDSAVGNYSITVTAWSGMRSRSASATVIITQRPTELTVPALLAGALAVALISLALTRRRFQSALRREESQFSQEYLAAARAVVKLEELRATEKIDEPTYLRLKQEYEEKVERLRKRRGP